MKLSAETIETVVTALVMVLAVLILMLPDILRAWRKR